jgi:dihydroorotate dehydrogenase electron transfer subunit
VKYKEYCPILEKKIDKSYLFLRVNTENIAKASKAGQFVNIRVSESLTPLLRRPISICDAEGDALTLMILIKGEGTRMLSEKQIGDKLNIIGPLGNGFPLPEKTPLFAAGGIGIAPFLFLSRSLPDTELLFGVKNADLLPDLSLFEKSLRIQIASEDGSIGRKGTVIDLLAAHNLADYSIYACGPNPMFHAMNTVFSKCSGIEAYYSIEAMMGCGFGACKGCAVETLSGNYKPACTEGPVFPWNEIKL